MRFPVLALVLIVSASLSSAAAETPRPATPVESMAVQMLVARHADEFALLKEIAQERIENERLADELAKAKAAKPAGDAKP